MRIIYKRITSLNLTCSICITELLTLQVSHLQSEGPHQVVVEQGGGGGGEVGGYQAGERSSFYTKNEFFFFVAILIAHCWFVVNIFHFRLHCSTVLSLCRIVFYQSCNTELVNFDSHQLDEGFWENLLATRRRPVYYNTRVFLFVVNLNLVWTDAAQKWGR